MKMKLSFVLLALTQSITSSVLAERFNVKEDPKSIGYFIRHSDQILVGEIKEVSGTNVAINVVQVLKGSPNKEFTLSITPTIIKTLNAFGKSNTYLFFIDLDSESRTARLFAGENGIMPLLKIKERAYAAFHSGTIMPPTPDDSRYFVQNPIPCDSYEQCFPFRVLEGYISLYIDLIRKNEEKEKLDEMERKRDSQINRIPDHIWESVSEFPDYSGVSCTTNYSTME